MPTIPPTLVCTVGMHASASTWVFNVTRALMVAAQGEARILSAYADQRRQVPPPTEIAGRHLILKSHNGDAEFDGWLAAEKARLFLSIRDPRDAALSQAQRFAQSLPGAVRTVFGESLRLAKLARQGHRLFRYEDRFFEDEAAVAQIATDLGLSLPPATLQSIFARFATEEVRRLAQSLADLPEDQVAMIGPFRMDPVTQILGPHIGDTASGKWRRLPEAQQAEMTRLLRPALEHFGYPLT